MSLFLLSGLSLLSQTEAGSYITLKAGVFSEIKDVCIPRIFIFSFDIN
jgi:hypothetical protein